MICAAGDVEESFKLLIKCCLEMDLNYSPCIYPEITEFSFNSPLVLHHTVIYWTGGTGRNSVVSKSNRAKLQRQSLELCCCFSPILGVEEETKQKFHIIMTDFTCGLISVVAVGFALAACSLFSSLI